MFWGGKKYLLLSISYLFIFTGFSFLITRGNAHFEAEGSWSEFFNLKSNTCSFRQPKLGSLCVGQSACLSVSP